MLVLAAALADLQAEAKCSICLEDPKDPITIECGHNFCHSCIQHYWADLQDKTVSLVLSVIIIVKKGTVGATPKIQRKHESIFRPHLQDERSNDGGDRKEMMSEVKLLTDIKSTFHRCESLRSPALLSSKLRKEEFILPLQFSALKKIRQKFREEVTLDPEQHILICLSLRIKSCDICAERGTCSSESREIHGLSSGSGFADSGRHYWEVQEGDMPEWIVGVCQDSISRNEKWSLSCLSRCWTIQLYNGVYVAQCTVPVTLWLMEKPRWIGIYLDYEFGDISFYNLNNRSHIQSFRDTFSEALKPYCSIGYDSTPLTICEVSDLEG
ncbi:tripartite motif-containing protein 75-like [Marmota marmota marmota]|uniref:tripartite motif-containing protein 75-like n=1 Tax=Marmota marmota marmota TaxID=9994 RepID=UPI002091FABF|nr:tripartite motif-containing protein 75-like [Marmota marmota marmota]